MMGRARLLKRWLTVWVMCFGLGLGWLLFNPVGSTRPITIANAQPQPTRTRFSDPTITPSTQGGNGANIFQVYCMPCHGDQGQGLTDEFRNRQYPPEDVNCWKSGCHGERPYDNGFTLPKTIPALIGSDTLQKFSTAQQLYNFIHAAMPFNAPGSLKPQQYLDLTAFLLERNSLVATGATLNVDSLSSIIVSKTAQLTVTPIPDRTVSPSAAPDNSSLWIGLVTFIVIATILSIVTRPRKK